jgi:hypothetical protein
MYFKNPRTQNHIRSKTPSQSNGWITIMRGFYGTFIIGLCNGKKKQDCGLNNFCSNKGACDLPSN